ncbi:MAG: FAD-dependent oxidoreductase [Myxococcales bacterium]|nr:FAD-dependent oxidoreductase [Myxococcales bacterium]
MHHVIVGNSIAGIEAALGIRRRDETARITLVSEESDHPFARTAMMYVFCGQLRLEDTEFHDRGLYDRLRFERVRDRVVGVDCLDHRVRLRRGGALSYDRLLLAVGSRARPLPLVGAYDGPGVFHYVSLQDHAALDVAAKTGLRAAVVGGGLIGVEVAEVLHARGLAVHWLVREAWTWPVALDRDEAALVEAHVRERGVDVVAGAAVTALERGSALTLTVGTEARLEVDLVVGAIGVVPNTGFLVGSQVALATDGGVETAANLSSTSAPDVYAAGDCATVTWADGSRRPETLWYTARDQGRVAGAAMVGESASYRRSTWYNSAKFFDLEYTTAGYVPLAEPVRRDPTAGHWQTWFQQHPSEVASLRIVVKDDRVVGFNALGRRWNTEVWLRWIHERRSLGWVHQHLADSSFDEEFMAPFPILPSACLHEGA